MSSNHEGKITKLFADQFCCAWEIDDYCFCERSDKKIISSEFKMEDNNDYVWYFKFIKGTLPLLHSLKLYLCLKNCENADFQFNETLTVEFGFLDKYSNCLDTRNVVFDHEKKCFHHSYYIPNYAVSHESCPSIPNSKLTVFCKIKNIQLTKYKKNQFYSLSKDFEWLYKNEKFSDLKIVVGEKQFHVHKAILASRSAVFLAMFENEMKEKKENKIDIIDIDQDVMQEVLRFIYTGKIENHNIVIGILAAAEKYAIEDLKIECSAILSDNITINNVNKILELADFYNIKNLKKATIDYIAVHVNEMVKALESISISDS